MKKTVYLASALLALAGSATFAQTGNVGIGTSTPALRLSVYSPLLDDGIAIGGGAPVLRFHGGPTTPGAVPVNFSIPYAKIALATSPGQFMSSSVPGDLVIQTIDTTKSIIFSNRFQVGGEQMRLNGVGNLGIGTTSPQTKLHILSNGMGGTGVFNTNTANTAQRLENSQNGQSVMQHFVAKDAAGAKKEFIMGINPTYGGGNGVFHMGTDGGFGQSLAMDLVTGSVGIGGYDPAARFLVNGGSVKIVDGTQGAGKVLTSDANGLASWQSGLVDPAAPRFASEYVSAAGGTELIYGNGDWINNAFSDLKLDEVADPNNVYDPATGVVTITQDGMYTVVSQIRMFNNPGPGTPFDGQGGAYYTQLMVKSSGAAAFVPTAKENSRVLRGSWIPGGLAYVDGNPSGTYYLKAGDQVKLAFTTYGTATFNNDFQQIMISRIQSFFRLYKL